MWCPISGDNGNDIDDGERWLLVLVPETLKKETDRLGTVPCPLERPRKPEALHASSPVSRVLQPPGGLWEIRPTHCLDGSQGCKGGQRHGLDRSLCQGQESGRE